MDLIKRTCDLLRDDGVPVHYDERTSTCKINKSGGILITLADDNLIVRNVNRDTLFVLDRPKEVSSVFDLYHGENVVRIRGEDGVVEFRYPDVGGRNLKVVLAVDSDKDNDIDEGAVRVWK